MTLLSHDKGVNNLLAKTISDCEKITLQLFDLFNLLFKGRI